MMGGGGQQQLQQLSQELQAIDEEIQGLEGDVQELQTRQTEIDEAVEAIETLDSGSTVQVPLGGGAYLRAEIQNIDEVIVDLGGGYAAEQPQDAAIDALERKRDTLDDRIAELREDIGDLESESDKLEQQAQQMQQQMQQQQMQQMQQAQQDDQDE
jgi:prefoldin alpha subunit